MIIYYFSLQYCYLFSHTVTDATRPSTGPGRRTVVCTLDRSRGMACNRTAPAARGGLSRDPVCGTISCRSYVIGRIASALEVLDGQLTLVVRY